MKGQTEQILKQIDELLEEGGATKKAFSATIYLADINTFAQMNEAWDAWVPGRQSAGPCDGGSEARQTGIQSGNPDHGVQRHELARPRSRPRALASAKDERRMTSDEIHARRPYFARKKSRRIVACKNCIGGEVAAARFASFVLRHSSFSTMLDPIRTQSNLAAPAHVREAETMRVSRATFDEVMFQTYVPAQFVPVRASGSRIWDSEGRDYVDLAGGVAVLSLGHCHPALNAALKAQADRMWHISNYMVNEPAMRLAQNWSTRRSPIACSCATAAPRRTKGR